MPDWPHSPAHRLDAAGAYLVTAATYEKRPLFCSAKRLTYLCESLLHLAAFHKWKLEAWAVFPNHYHFVATSPAKAVTLPQFIGHLHTVTAKEINRQDEAPGRKVWFQYWDSHLTYQRSYSRATELRPLERRAARFGPSADAVRVVLGGLVRKQRGKILLSDGFALSLGPHSDHG